MAKKIKKKAKPKAKKRKSKSVKSSRKKIKTRRKVVTKKVSLFLIQRQENEFMECLIQIGKVNIKNNYFSFSLGKSSTKLQGL